MAFFSLIIFVVCFTVSFSHKGAPLAVCFDLLKFVGQKNRQYNTKAPFIRTNLTTNTFFNRSQMQWHFQQSNIAKKESAKLKARMYNLFKGGINNI